MGLKYILAFIVIATLPLTESFSRELTFQEKASVLTFERTKKVMEFMEKQIDVQELSIPEYVSYQLMKKSCTPVDLQIAAIKRGNEDYKDRSKILQKFYYLCMEGSLGLTSLHIKQL